MSVPSPTVFIHLKISKGKKIPSRKSKIRAFITGMVIGSIACAPFTALASQIPSPADDIARDYPAYQEAPTSPAEVDDAITAMETGLTPTGAVAPQPIPYRDYAVFLSDLWDLLFETDFAFGSSSLTFDSWIPDGSGILQGTNENGVVFTAEILFSLAAPQDERIGITPQQALELDAVNANLGVSWINIITESSEAKLFGWWTQIAGPDGTTTATFVPTMIVSSEAWSNLAYALPVLLENIDTIWDEDNNDIYRESPWGAFRRKIRSAARVAAVVVAVAAVVAVVAIAAPVIAGAAVATAVTSAVVGTTVFVGATVTAATIFDEKVKNANQELRNALDDDLPDYIDVDALTDAEIAELGEAWYLR